MIYQSHTEELIASIYPKLLTLIAVTSSAKLPSYFLHSTQPKETDTNFQFPVRALP